MNKYKYIDIETAYYYYNIWYYYRFTHKVYKKSINLIDNKTKLKFLLICKFLQKDQYKHYKEYCYMIEKFWEI